MSYAVKYQADLWRGRLHEGDVLVSNHPSCGGTHLPDITVITPYFGLDGDISFYVASRGHHADIGGILPGSMPPVSTALWQEGAAIESTKLVSEGAFREDEMRRLLSEVPSQYEGCSGTRRLQDNISDLKAQIAANAKGILQIKALISEFGVSEVHRYMYGIQDAAAQSVRELLKGMVVKFGSEPLHAVDYMDDGTKIELTVTISADGSAVFDFAGTGPHVLGNTNAPMAITNSAIIYCLRAMMATDIPLNQGCLNPVTVKIPPDTILNPGDGLAVVGGNVLTSQRVTDVVLKCFHAAAASQGCCNNLTFGTGGKDPVTGLHHDGFGYYETIAGGAGAGPGWVGTSGVHTHMTKHTHHGSGGAREAIPRDPQALPAAEGVRWAGPISRRGRYHSRHRVQSAGAVFDPQRAEGSSALRNGRWRGWASRLELDYKPRWSGKIDYERLTSVPRPRRGFKQGIEW